MTSVGPTTRRLVNELAEGERIRVEHEVKVGMQKWTTSTVGAVARIERRRHGLHYRRNPDDKVYSDEILLRLDDGSLTTVAVDEFTRIERT